jgi:nitronate monooxygenase
MWPDRRLLELLRIELPIVQAPVAGAMDWELAAAAAQAGALGSLPCAMLNANRVREQMEKIRGRTKKPINLNFFVIRRGCSATRAKRAGANGLYPITATWGSAS